MLGNLIDNAFEAVEHLAADKQRVVLRIFESGKHFVFQTIDPGFIAKELRDKIFEQGFSTKQGSRGFGLASVTTIHGLAAKAAAYIACRLLPLPPGVTHLSGTLTAY